MSSYVGSLNRSTSNVHKPFNFVKGFKELWTTKDFADFSVVGGGSANCKLFRVHKIVLTTQSPVLATLLKIDMKEKQLGQLKIDDFSAEVVEEMLQFLYTGEVKDEKNAMDLYAIAGKYEISHLKEETEQMILRNIDITNVLEVYGLANLHNSEQMKTKAFNVIESLFPGTVINYHLINKPEAVKEIVEAHRKHKRTIDESEKELNSKLKKFEYLTNLF